jgi:hypothetical protein
MQICQNCAKERNDRDVLCPFCGHAVNATGPTPTPHAGAVVPDTVRPLSSAIPRRVSFNSKATIRTAMAAGSALGLIAAATFIVMSRSTGAQTNAAASQTSSATATGNKTVLAPSAIAERAASSTPPKWSRTRQSTWATDGTRTIGFELEAERDVPVYMDRVRPLLAVRCISHRTQVFVVLKSAASIENGGDTHTVKIRLDGEPEAEEEWLDSADKQALFAPDGEAFAARMATARSLHFAFRPFNAPPATIEFDVHGFEGPLAAMAKTCAAPSKSRPATRVGDSGLHAR